MPSFRKEIFDALTDDSSRNGCDPDWRRQVLDDASTSDLNLIKEALSRGEPEQEVLTRLRIEGKLI